MNNNKPLINCAIETNVENTCFKFVKVDEGIRNKGTLGIFNGYKIYSYGYPECYEYYGYDKCIFIFGCDKECDNDIVNCDKEVILALEEAGCKIEIKEK